MQVIKSKSSTTVAYVTGIRKNALGGSGYNYRCGGICVHLFFFATFCHYFVDQYRIYLILH